MPQATVAAVILTHTDGGSFVLLTKRAGPPFEGMFCLPGGHIEKNEQAKDAILREVKEEIGIDLDPNDLEEIAWRDEIVPEDGIHNVVLCYICEEFTGEVVPDPKEVSEWFWCDYEEACKMKLAFDHQELLKVL
jgi:8-oxo-dGTP diphosphatase